MKYKAVLDPVIRIAHNSYNTLVDTFIKKIIQYLKQKFGVELKHLTDDDDFKDFLSKIESLCGVKILNQFEKKYFPHISIFKIVKLDNHTFIYIQWGRVEGVRTTGYVGNIYIFGKNSYKYCNKCINTEEKDKKTVIYTITNTKDSESDWEGVMLSAVPRSFDTLYLDDNISQKIKDHIDKWKSNREIYKVRGLKFKTGILLYGPPGTGKSSIAAAVADYLNCNLIIIDSSTFSYINLSSLTASIESDDHMYVILLDDIDVIFKSRDDNTATSQDKSNIAKLLGFLDSSNSPDNVVFIATTNHVELLDKAVTRSGRFDKIYEISDITPDIAIKMCEGFGLSYEESKELVDSKNKESINPADLQVEILEVLKHNINE